MHLSDDLSEWFCVIHVEVLVSRKSTRKPTRKLTLSFADEIHLSCLGSQQKSTARPQAPSKKKRSPSSSPNKSTVRQARRRRTGNALEAERRGVVVRLHPRASRRGYDAVATASRGGTGGEGVGGREVWSAARAAKALKPLGEASANASWSKNKINS